MKPSLHLCIAILSALGFLFLCSNQSMAINTGDPGEIMYKTGRWEEARKYYEAKISAAPKDADAHYMLANILLALKQPADAAQQYKISISLDPNGVAGQYSRTALKRLARNFSAEQLLVKPTNQNNQAVPVHNKSLSSNLNDSQKVENSVLKISREVDREEQKKQANCDSRVKRIYEEADIRVKKLDDEMHEAIAANGPPLYANGVHIHPIESSSFVPSSFVKVYDPEPANETIRQDYKKRIDEVRRQARTQADGVIATYKTKVTALEQSALALDKSYIHGQSSGNVKLNPTNTNIYIRNYQTQPSPSGNPVPVLAAPAKSLAGSPPKPAPSH